MKSAIIKFREIIQDNICSGLKKRFDEGEFDRGIEMFLRGKIIEITFKKTFNGTALTELTKGIIEGLPMEDSIKRFNEAVVELERKPVDVVDETKKRKNESKKPLSA